VKPKRESKLFKLEFEPELAFQKLKRLAGGLLSVSKDDLSTALAVDKAHRKRKRSRL
jgi:hypothetical protein